MAATPSPQQTEEIMKRVNQFIQNNGVLQTVQKTFTGMTEEQMGKMTISEYMNMISKAAGDFLLQNAITPHPAQLPHYPIQQQIGHAVRYDEMAAMQYGEAKNREMLGIMEDVD